MVGAAIGAVSGLVPGGAAEGAARMAGEIAKRFVSDPVGTIGSAARSAAEFAEQRISGLRQTVESNVSSLIDRATGFIPRVQAAAMSFYGRGQRLFEMLVVRRQNVRHISQALGMGAVLRSMGVLADAQTLHLRTESTADKIAGRADKMVQKMDRLERLFTPLISIDFSLARTQFTGSKLFAKAMVFMSKGMLTQAKTFVTQTRQEVTQNRVQTLLFIANQALAAAAWIQDIRMERSRIVAWVHKKVRETRDWLRSRFRVLIRIRDVTSLVGAVGSFISDGRAKVQELFDAVQSKIGEIEKWAQGKYQQALQWVNAITAHLTMLIEWNRQHILRGRNLRTQFKIKGRLIKQFQLPAAMFYSQGIIAFATTLQAAMLRLQTRLSSPLTAPITGTGTRIRGTPETAGAVEEFRQKPEEAPEGQEGEAAPAEEETEVGKENKDRNRNRVQAIGEGKEPEPEQAGEQDPSKPKQQGKSKQAEKPGAKDKPGGEIEDKKPGEEEKKKPEGPPIVVDEPGQLTRIPNEGKDEGVQPPQPPTGPVADGGMTGPFYPRNYRGKIYPDAESASENRGRVAFYVNGVLTDLDTHMRAAQALANQTGKPVVGIYNASRGGLRDTAQSLADKVGIGGMGAMNPATRTLERIASQQGPRDRRQPSMEVYAHSQGSIIVSEALRRTRDQGGDLSNIDVTTFGNAAWSMPRGLGGQHHYAFDSDVIPSTLGSTSLIGRAMDTVGNPLMSALGMRSTTADSFVLHHSGSGIRPHGVVPDPVMGPDGKPKRDAQGQIVYDDEASYIGSLGQFRAKEQRERATQARLGPLGPLVNAADSASMPLRSGLATAFSFARAAGSTLADKVSSGYNRWSSGISNLMSFAGAGPGMRAAFATADAGMRWGGRQIQSAGEGYASGVDRRFGLLNRLQREGEGISATAEKVDPVALRAELARAEGQGQQLSSEQRMDLGPYVGFDPARARVHVGPAAAVAASRLQASAFTIADDVYFGAGRYQPSTLAGRALLAHELTHVRQQSGSDLRRFTQAGGDSMEQEARQVGERVLAGAGRREGIHVEVYVRRYESESGDGIAQSDVERLDRISLLALSEAEGMLQSQGPQTPVELGDLEIQVHLNLESLTDQEAARVWAEAIVGKIPQHFRSDQASPALQLSPDPSPAPEGSSAAPPTSPSAPSTDPAKMKKQVVKTLESLMKLDVKWVAGILEEEQPMLFMVKFQSILSIFEKWFKQDEQWAEKTGYRGIEFLDKFLYCLQVHVFCIEGIITDRWTNAHDELWYQTPSGMQGKLKEWTSKGKDWQTTGPEMEKPEGMASYVGKRVGFGALNVAMTMGEGLASTVDSLTSSNVPVIGPDGKLTWKKSSLGLGDWVHANRMESLDALDDWMGIDSKNEKLFWGFNLRSWTDMGGKVIWGLTMAGKLGAMGKAGGAQAAVATIVGLKMTADTLGQLIDRIALLRKKGKSWREIVTDPEAILLAAGVFAGAVGAGAGMAQSGSQLANALSKIGIAANAAQLGAIGSKMWAVMHDPTLSDAEKRKQLEDLAADAIVTAATTANDINEMRKTPGINAEIGKTRAAGPDQPAAPVEGVAQGQAAANEPTPAPVSPPAEQTPGATLPTVPVVEPVPQQGVATPKPAQEGSKPPESGSKPSEEASKPPEGGPKPPEDGYIPPERQLPAGKPEPLSPKQIGEMERIRGDVRALKEQRQAMREAATDASDAELGRVGKEDQAFDSEIRSKEAAIKKLEEQAGMAERSELKQKAEGLDPANPKQRAELLDLIRRNKLWNRLSDLGLGTAAESRLLEARRQQVMEIAAGVEAEFGVKVHDGKTKDVASAPMDEKVSPSSKISSDLDLSVQGERSAEARQALQKKLDAEFGGDSGSTAAVNTFLDAKMQPITDSRFRAQMERTGEAEGFRRLQETNPAAFAKQKEIVLERATEALEKATKSNKPDEIAQAKQRLDDLQRLFNQAETLNKGRAEELEAAGGDRSKVRHQKELELQARMKELSDLKAVQNPDAATQRRIEKLSFQVNEKLMEVLSWTPEAYTTHGGREFPLGGRETATLPNASDSSVRQAALDETSMFYDQLGHISDPIARATHAAKYLARHLNEAAHLLETGKYETLRQYAEQIKSTPGEAERLQTLMELMGDGNPKGKATKFVKEAERLIMDLNAEMQMSRDVDTGPGGVQFRPGESSGGPPRPPSGGAPGAGGKGSVPGGVIVRTLTNETVVVDTNAARAMAKAANDPKLTSLNDRERAIVLELQRTVKPEDIPLLLRVAVTQGAIDELAVKGVEGTIPTSPRNPMPPAERAAALEVLEKASVGGATKGVGDREIVLQTLESAPDPSVVPTLLTGDDGMIKGLARIAGIDPANLGGAKSVAEWLRINRGTDTFEVTINGRKLKVKPIQ